MLVVGKRLGSGALRLLRGAMTRRDTPRTVLDLLAPVTNGPAVVRLTVRQYRFDSDLVPVTPRGHAPAGADVVALVPRQRRG
jgi:hypothetical protein